MDPLQATATFQSIQKATQVVIGHRLVQAEGTASPRWRGHALTRIKLDEYRGLAQAPMTDPRQLIWINPVPGTHRIFFASLYSHVYIDAFGEVATHPHLELIGRFLA